MKLRQHCLQCPAEDEGRRCGCTGHPTVYPFRRGAFNQTNIVDRYLLEGVGTSKVRIIAPDMNTNQGVETLLHGLSARHSLYVLTR